MDSNWPAGAPMGAAQSPTTLQLAHAVQQLNAGLHDVLRQLQELRKRVYPLEATAALRARGQEPTMPIVFRAQLGEDLLLYDLLRNEPPGLIVEAGAFDGLGFSVSYAFEAMGWRALLVEAIPRRAAECKVNRPHARVVHAALTAPGGPNEVEFTITQDQHGGMLSYLTSDAAHQQALRAAAVPSSTARVPATTLDELLADERTPFNALVLDLEGGEADALRGIDMNRHAPAVVLIEDNNRDDRCEAHRLMCERPYVYVGMLDINRLYVHRNRPDLLERAKQL